MDFFLNSQLDKIEVSAHPTGWGPILGKSVAIFEDTSYAHFDKKERIFRAADFVQSNHIRPRPGKPMATETTINAAFVPTNSGSDGFALVDTSKKVKSRTFNANQGNQRSNKRTGKGVETHANSYGGRGGNRPVRRIQKHDRDPSINVLDDWEQLPEVIDLNRINQKLENQKSDFSKVITNATDLLWCGKLDSYNEQIERITSTKPTPLETMEQLKKAFFSVRAVNDTTLLGYLDDVDVLTTDSILAHLVASPKSVYSWDIVVTKMDGKLIFDRREDSDLDFLTVSETASEPPSSQDAEDVNSPSRLAVEATEINQRFSQATMQRNINKTKSFDEQPFWEGSTPEPASVAYRYRSFNVDGNKVAVRCELNGYYEKDGGEKYVNTYAFNEWGGKKSVWQDLFSRDKKSVIWGEELRNNACKVAKWTVQSLLSGADYMKFGFVTRNVSTPGHRILHVTSNNPKSLASQIGLSPNYMWGIFKFYLDYFRNLEDGTYLMLRDPVRPVIKVFRVPDGAFEQMEEEDGEDEEGADEEAADA